MKKIVLLVFAFLLLLAPAGCSNPDSPQQVELSFGSETAYFSGQEELYPIAGDTPAEGDAVEEAAVTLRAQPAAVLVLTLQYAEGAQTLDGLMVKVDGNAPVAVSDGMTLYQSAGAESEKQVTLVFYLSHEAPLSDRGKSLNFNLVLHEAEI